MLPPLKKFKGDDNTGALLNLHVFAACSKLTIGVILLLITGLNKSIDIIPKYIRPNVIIENIPEAVPNFEKAELIINKIKTDNIEILLYLNISNISVPKLKIFPFISALNDNDDNINQPINKKDKKKNTGMVNRNPNPKIITNQIAIQ